MKRYSQDPEIVTNILEIIEALTQNDESRFNDDVNNGIIEELFSKKCDLLPILRYKIPKFSNPF